MKLPIFCIIGIRPVKAVSTADGGMRVLAFNWKTGEFERDMKYLERVVLPDTGVDVVDEDEFERQVSKLRAKLKET